ncbi:hypothetical protein GCM10017744_008030 [Streptomyces antimycoticus]
MNCGAPSSTPRSPGSLFPDIITTALVNTVVYTLLGFGFGLVLGVVLALMRLSQVPPYRWLAVAYIEFFRGVPALLVFIALGFGVPLAFQVALDRHVTVMLALGLVGAAYIAETMRAGIQAVPKGQMEAARSLACPTAGRWPRSSSRRRSASSCRRSPMNWCC